MSNRKVVGVIASLAVLGLVVAGLFAAGSPADARRLKADAERTRRLVELHSNLASQVAETGSLPNGLKDLLGSGFEGFGQGFDPRKEPDTGRFFEYTKLGDRKYEVCARFLTSSNDPRRDEFNQYGPGAGLDYQPGRNCFTRTITKRQIDDAGGFRGSSGVPAPPVPVPAPAPAPSQ